MVNNKYFNIVLNIIIILLSIYLIIFNIFIKEKETEVIDNSSEQEIKYLEKNLNDSQIVKGFKFYNSGVLYNDKVGSLLNVNVVNNSSKKIYLSGVSATIYDKNNEKIVSLYYKVAFHMNANEEIFLTYETDKNIYDCSKIIYTPIYDEYLEDNSNDEE